MIICQTVFCGVATTHGYLVVCVVCDFKTTLWLIVLAIYSKIYYNSDTIGLWAENVNLMK